MKFIESIRLEDGIIFHLELHQRRLSLTLLAHYGRSVKINLENELSHRSLPAHGLFKIRVTYAKAIESIEIEPYQRSLAQRVEIVQAEGIDYRYKYADRSALDALRAGVTPGTQPILQQGPWMTDAIHANVCFFDRQAQCWVTPEKPLLAGIAREVALAAGLVSAAPVLAEDVLSGRFQMVKLINCMNWFQESREVKL